MKGKEWSKEEISSFCLEFSLLLQAGLPGTECFSILAEEEKDGAKKDVLLGLYETTSYGGALYEAMEETGVFPAYMLKMVRMGEETGYLESVFHSLSVYYEERRRTEQALKETVVFPIVLLVMMLAVVVLLMTEVLPVFQAVFAQLGGTLSPVALFFLNLGVALRHGRGAFAVIGVLIIVAAVIILVHEPTRAKWNVFWSRNFAKTKAGRLYEEAHFASALYMGVSGGLSIDYALEMAGTFCEGEEAQRKINACMEQTDIGMPFAEAIGETGLLKPMYCRMLSVGIKTGALDAALEEISRRSQEEASSALAKLAAKVEPAVVILLSVVVGVLLLSVMFPLVGIMNSLG